MSVLDTQIATDLANVMADVGRDVTYTPAGGSGTTVSAIVPPYRKAVDDYDETSREAYRSVEIIVQISEVATPAIGDQFTFDDLTWAVTEIAGISSAYAILRLLEVRRSRTQTSAGGYKDMPR